MSKIENIDLVRKLSPGAYAFNCGGQVIFLDFMEKPGEYLVHQVSIQVARLGDEEEPVIIANQNASGTDFDTAFGYLRPDLQGIIAEFAFGQVLEEGEIMRVA